MVLDRWIGNRQRRAMAMATSSDENLVQNFAQMIRGIENQTKLLKYSYSLHGALLAAEGKGTGALQGAQGATGATRGVTASSLEIKQKLTSLSSNISHFQINLNEFEDFLDKELTALNSLQEFQQNQLTQQQEVIQQTENNLPSFFSSPQEPHDHYDDHDPDHAPSARGRGNEVEKNGKGSRATAPPAILLIALNEFEKIPKSTRGRLTLEHTIDSLNHIQHLILQKEEVRLTFLLLAMMIFVEIEDSTKVTLQFSHFCSGGD